MSNNPDRRTDRSVENGMLSRRDLLQSAGWVLAAAAVGPAPVAAQTGGKGEQVVGPRRAARDRRCLGRARACSTRCASGWGLPGSKNACEQGECGSCSVYLDGTLGLLLPRARGVRRRAARS